MNRSPNEVGSARLRLRNRAANPDLEDFDFDGGSVPLTWRLLKLRYDGAAPCHLHH
jgi:hypothetical protein